MQMNDAPALLSFHEDEGPPTQHPVSLKVKSRDRGIAENLNHEVCGTSE